MKIKRDPVPGFFGNLLFGGVIGLIIDASNGAIYKLTPDQIVAQMEKHVASTTVKNSDGIYIAVVLRADLSWEQIGTLTRAE